MNKCCIIFGGTGFIGTAFSKFLVELGAFKKIILVDIQSIKDKKCLYRESLICSDDRIIFIQGDVRKDLTGLKIPFSVYLIVNFAAIHREPGHEDWEYFETNLLGAENVCKFAEIVGCQNIILSSSISPYGVSEFIKDESTLPLPVTAYGASKLVAEKIHEVWQARDGGSRRLVIVRPGVVFGPGEGGNVSRLIKAVTHGYFFFMGNQSTRKAGVYINELCNAIWWVYQQQKFHCEMISLFNMTMNPGPSISEYVNAIKKSQRIVRHVPTVPYSLLITVSYLIDAIAKPFRIEHPFSPVRIRKLVRSNNILPAYLIDRGYEYQYSIESAFADWKKSYPKEWQ